MMRCRLSIIHSYKLVAQQSFVPLKSLCTPTHLLQSINIGSDVIAQMDIEHEVGLKF